jgi:hypothetical protein
MCCRARVPAVDIPTIFLSRGLTSSDKVKLTEIKKTVS